MKKRQGDHMRRFSFRSVLFSLIFCVSFASVDSIRSQSQPERDTEDIESCGQAEDVRDPLINEAHNGQFNVRRVWIVGSTYTRYREFGKRMYQSEGDIFTREKLEKTVKRISKMRSIYPINMDNIEVRLDRNNGYIDIVFCVKQKPKNK